MQNLLFYFYIKILILINFKYFLLNYFFINYLILRIFIMIYLKILIFY
jgi:hypothetical protein